MAKPWEKYGTQQTAKPWERYGPPAASAANLTDPDKVPTGEDLALAKAAPSKLVPDKSTWQRVKETVTEDPVLNMLGDAAVTTAKGAPEVAATMANNAVVDAYAGIGAPMAGLLGEAPNGMGRYVEDVQATNHRQLQGESAKKLGAGIAEAFEPVVNVKNATLGRVAEQANKIPVVGPGLATAIDKGPEMFLATLGAKPSTGSVVREAPQTLRETLGGRSTTAPKTGDFRTAAEVNAPQVTSKSKTNWDVQHTVDEATGAHEFKTQNGAAIAQESGPYLQLKRIDVDPALQTNGQGTAMIVRNVDEAAKRGLTAASDVTLSGAAVKAYEKLKKDPEFDVHENPSSPGANPKDPGSRVSDDPRVPIFEVKRKLADKKNASQEELHKDAVDTLLKNNVGLTTEQRGTGLLNKQAGSIGRAADLIMGKSGRSKQQLQQFTTAVLKKLGVDAKNATPDALAEVKTRAEGLYEDAHRGANVKMDGQFIADLKELRAQARRNPTIEGKFEKQLDHIMRKGRTGNMTAADATTIRAELGRIEGSADSNISNMARDIKNALDEAASRSATPEQRAKMIEARKHYHWMKQVEGAVDQAGGFISPKKLLAKINVKRNRNEVVYGKGDQELVDLARAGAKILPDVVGDSGTAARSLDVVKAGMLLAHPQGLAQLAMATFGGRLMNEGRLSRGTAEAIAMEKAGKLVPNMTGTPIKATVVSSRVPKNETEEQKKRRLAIEALRSD